MRKVIVIGIIIFGVVMIANITKEHQVSESAKSAKTEHWMLPAKQQPFSDGLVHVVLTNEYPLVDASEKQYGQTDKGNLFFRQSLPPPSRLD